MGKLWLVAKQEFRNRTFRRSFVIGTLVIPLMIAIIIGVTLFIIERSRDNRPFGYIDYSGRLNNAAMPEENKDSVAIISFPDEKSARLALEEDKIQGYHIIAEDYLETQNVDLYFMEEPPSNSVLRNFDDYVRANILDNAPSATQSRIIEGYNLTVRSVSDNREFQDNGTGIITIFLPFIIAMFFLFAVMGASGYFLQIVTDEKENRTMEIIITSVSPSQLIVGKSLGLITVGITQIVVWIVSIVFTWIVTKHFIDELNSVQLPWETLIIFLLFFFPSYAITAGVMICIGSVVAELQEGQQISGVLNLLFTFPIFFSALIFADPNSPLLIFLSYWPTTSFMTIIMRWGFTHIPLWQIALSWFICSTVALIVIWIASRLFRLGMLRYGQRVELKSALIALRPGKIG